MKFPAFVIGLLALTTPMAAAQTCDPTPETHAVRIKGKDALGRLNAHMVPEIYGHHNFAQKLPNGWEFLLSRAKWGWQIGVYADGHDLTALTPPRMGPNPREIYGWHFRNADNTGPNTGEVNAPQDMRAFMVSPKLAGGVSIPDTLSRGDGMGWLRIERYGLSDLVSGKQASMSYLAFNACIRWPKTEADKRAEADANSLDFTETDQEIYGACGLDLSRYKLQAHFTPRALGGDLDGDGAIDQIAQIIRKSDGRQGLALCRAGTWMQETGFEPGPVADILPATEKWVWHVEGEDLPLSLSGLDLPEAEGDILILERVEKQAVAMYWQDGTLKTQTLFQLVTE